MAPQVSQLFGATLGRYTEQNAQSDNNTNSQFVRSES